MIRILAFAAVIAATLTPAPAAAAELIMFEQPGCPFCIRWNRDIGPVYPKTEYGAKAPLRRVQIADRPSYKVTLKTPVVYTPTFVIAVDGQEVSRIEGYMNDESFWGLLGQKLADAP